MTSILEQRLERAVAQLGGDSYVAQSLRDQIARVRSAQSARDLYVTGSVTRSKVPPKIDE